MVERAETRILWSSLSFFTNTPAAIDYLCNYDLFIYASKYLYDNSDSKSVATVSIWILYAETRVFERVVSAFMV